MKINAKKIPFDEVQKLPKLKHKNPRKPSTFLATVVRVAVEPTLRKIKFSYTEERMELVGKDEPCLILMNHSSFTDMKLAYGIFYPRKLGIVTSVDAMSGILGKLMRFLGCTPTHKYITDVSLLKDIEYMLRVNKSSVLMYPEAGYSFDGRSTALPKKMGVLMMRLGVPVVTVITEGAFANCTNLEKVTIKSGATHIDEWCFVNCYYLETVTMPNTVVYIGMGAFSGCASLENIKLSTSLEELSSEAFAGCKSLTSVKIPSKVTELPYRAFYGCQDLESVTRGSAVTVIDFEAFADCTSLTSISLPGKLEYLDESAFKGCRKLKAFTYKGETYTSTEEVQALIGE